MCISDRLIGCERRACLELCVDEAVSADNSFCAESGSRVGGGVGVAGWREYQVLQAGDVYL